jgi:hypothetical protein
MLIAFRWRAVLASLAVLFLLLVAKPASAYPWMIRHEYTGCGQCHVDPDGAGLLTEYGRAQGETLLRTQYTAASPDEEPGRVKDFLWGAVKTPEWLLLGGSFRPALLAVSLPGQALDVTPLVMEADLRAGIKYEGWRASASVGVVSEAGSLASIAGPVVSREHWVGYTWDDESLMVRAGRINLPFGIRSIEHPLWVRAMTRTDIDDNQDHGIAFDYSGTLFRASVMGILGNYQISPDAFRDRGYAGFLEMAPLSRLAIGVSSLVVHTEKDLDLGVPDWRQAHGAYVRASPFKALVIMGEGDMIVNTVTPSSASSVGFASMLQADVEPVQGIHLIATGESLSPGGLAPRSSFGAWASVHWFFLPHADVRFDYIYRAQANGEAPPPGTLGGGLTTASSASIPVTTYLAQLHVYL